jgi:hypothetical protein
MTDKQLAAVRVCTEHEVEIENETVIALLDEIDALQSTVSYMRLMILGSSKARYAGEA